MIHVDVLSRRPVYEQIIRQTERLILIGALKPGEQITSVRALSAQLAINPNTIQKAYGDLLARGILVAVPGKGCFVAENAAQLLGCYQRRQLDELAHKVREWKLAGIPLQEIEQCIRKAYNEEEMQ